MELLFKQLKQNAPLKYFLTDNENAIEIQIWVAKGGAFRNKIMTLIINKQYQRKLGKIFLADNNG